MNEKTESRPAPWWELPPSTWAALLVLGLFSVVFSLWPILFDWTTAGILRFVDFRGWPWWYYFELLIVAGISVRWFLLYVAHYNDELDERGREEAKRFIHLSGFLAAVMLLYTILHRFTVQD